MGKPYISLEVFIFKLIAQDKTRGETFKLMTRVHGHLVIEKIWMKFNGLPPEEQEKYKQMPFTSGIYRCLKCRDEKVYRDEWGGLTFCTHPLK